MSSHQEHTLTTPGFESKREQQERMLREAFFPNGELTNEEAEALEDEFDFDELELPSLAKGQKIYKGQPIEQYHHLPIRF